jgi:uncharacterized phage protein (TIGR02216 family)
MNAENQGFPWRRMMELGLGVMGLSPRDFWAATPREIAAAFPARQRNALGRAELDDLMKQFPDAP